MQHTVYKRRWVLLACIFLSTTARQFFSASFAVANNAVAYYFDVTPYQVDLLTIGDTMIAIFICLLLSVIGDNIGVRSQTLIVASSMTIGAMLSCFSFVHRRLYKLLIVGRIISGVSTAILYVLPASLSNIWFPANELGVALSVPFVGFGVGAATSIFLFSFMVPSRNASYIYSSENDTYIVRTQSVFTTVFGIMTAVLAANFIILWICSKDRPPTSPSEAEALLHRREDTERFNVVSNLKTALELFKSRPFLLLTTANFLGTSSLVICNVLLPSLIRSTFPDVSSEVIACITSLTLLTGSISSIISGKALDKMGSYKTMSCAGALLSSGFSIGVYFGHFYSSATLLWVFYPLMMASRTFTITSYIEFLIETTYPVRKTVLMSLHFTAYNLSFFVMTSLERLADDVRGPSYAAIVPVVANVLAFICVAFVKPDYRRSHLNYTRLGI